MWIIAKNLPIYLSAQATEGLISDSNELSNQLEQSVMWRSKPSSSKTWLRRLKRNSSTPRLFSQTLKPSLGDNLVEEWTSSVEGFLVNHLVPLEEREEMKTQDTCGPTLSMESNGLEDLPLFSSRTWREYSVVNSNQTSGQTLKERPFCSMSIESWKKWVTEQRQAYSQRVKLARRIEEKGSSYLVLETTSQMKVGNGSVKEWATPRANKTGSENYEKWKKRADKGQVHTMPLGLQVEVSGQLIPHQEKQSSTLSSHQELPWATPMATGNHTGSSVGYRLRRKKIGKQVDLNGQVMLQNWGTPTTRDWKDAANKREVKPRKDGTRRMSLVPQQVLHQENYRGKLNPRWVEMLMGLPIGWVMPSCTNPVTIEQTSLECSEMESYQTPQEEPLKSCGKNWPTPPASQRGENLDHYLSRMKDRVSRGFNQPFAPTLQVQVEAAERGVNIKKELNEIGKPWGTPTVFDCGSMKRKSLSKLLSHIQSGGRKKRSTTGNLNEQVESPEVEFTYYLVSTYYTKGITDMSLKDFVIQGLTQKGYLELLGEGNNNE